MRHNTVMASLVLMLLLCAGGCTDVERARFKEQNERFLRRQAEMALKERVDEYWDFARWYAWQETARFYERGDQQLKHLEQGTGKDPALLPKIDAVEVQFIYVDNETRKTGDVRVRWREIPERSTEVIEKNTNQRWYKRGAQWWLAPADGIPDDEHDDLGDKERSARAQNEQPPELETVVPDAGR